MKGDTVQPTRISKEEYVRFKQFVEDVHGTTRGHLKTEIENALREYRKPDNSRDALSRIEDDVATIKATLATAEADGGTVVDTPFADEHTHARPDTTPTVPSEKPAPNAPSEKKVRWLASELLEKEVPNTGELQQVARSSITELVKDRYGFRSDTAKRYVSELVDHFELQAHPQAGDSVLVTEHEYRNIVADEQEQRAKEAKQEVEEKL